MHIGAVFNESGTNSGRSSSFLFQQQGSSSIFLSFLVSPFPCKDTFPQNTTISKRIFMSVDISKSTSFFLLLLPFVSSLLFLLCMIQSLPIFPGLYLLCFWTTLLSCLLTCWRGNQLLVYWKCSHLILLLVRTGKREWKIQKHGKTLSFDTFLKSHSFRSPLFLLFVNKYVPKNLKTSQTRIEFGSTRK